MAEQKKADAPDEGQEFDPHIHRDEQGNVIIGGDFPKPQPELQPTSEPELEAEPAPEPIQGVPAVPKGLAATVAAADKSAAKKGVPPDLVPDVPEDAPSAQEDADDTVPPAPAAPEAMADDDMTPFDDEKTDQAIDDIVIKESDELLGVQDKTPKPAVPFKKKKHHPVLRALVSKWTRWTLFVLLVAGATVLLFKPQWRYTVLNAAGVRSSASVTVTDNTTDLPLKGVHVTLGPQTLVTNSKGTVDFKNLRLGPQHLQIAQVGFSGVSTTITIGWGSNPLGNYPLKAVGIQYTLNVYDYLSGRPIAGAEASNGETTAMSDQNGKVTFSFPSLAAAGRTVTVSKDGYRSESLELGSDPKKPSKVTLVISRKVVYVSKQNGTYDVYKSDIDGKNSELLLAGTGNEGSNVSLVTSPDGTYAALVDTRDGKQDAQGAQLNTLTLITVDTGKTVSVTQAPQIQLVDWIGTRLIYEQVSSDSTSSNRYLLVSYDCPSNARLQLTSANKLNAVMSAQGVVYYAPASNDGQTPGFFSIKPDGSSKQTLSNKEVWSIVRTGYNTFALQMADGSWSNYNNSSNTLLPAPTPPSVANRLYIDNTAGSESLWINQGTLFKYDVSANKDITVTTQAGLVYPAEWLDDSTILYRISNGSETADYVISTLGGTAHKVADVAATYGYAQSQ